MFILYETDGTTHPPNKVLLEMWERRERKDWLVSDRPGGGGGGGKQQSVFETYQPGVSDMQDRRPGSGVQDPTPSPPATNSNSGILQSLKWPGSARKWCQIFTEKPIIYVKRCFFFFFGQIMLMIRICVILLYPFKLKSGILIRKKMPGSTTLVPINARELTWKSIHGGLEHCLDLTCFVVWRCRNN